MNQKDRTCPEYLAKLLWIRGLDIYDEYGKQIETANSLHFIKMKNAFEAGARLAVLNTKWPNDFEKPDFEKWIKNYYEL
jgi:hypothetical protein